jgi:hypothetical protein
MLRPASRLLLLYYMQQPDGRFRAPGRDDLIDDLLAVDAVKQETGIGYRFGYQPGELMRVDGLFLEPSCIEHVRETVRSDFPGENIDKLPDLRVLVDLILNRRHI